MTSDLPLHLVFHRSGLRRSIVAALVFIVLVCAPIAAQNTRNLERERPPTTAEKRLALVIGNGNYRNAAPLPNPPNDATDMVATLRDLGFEVISGTDQTKQQMETLIRRFGARLAETKATGLFFYAGHGLAKGGTNYLVPVDADIQAEDEVEYGSISINFLLGKMATADNGFNIVILDACRNNPFARKWRNYRDIGDKGGLARMDAPTGTLIAYATKPGDVASDGTGRNGLYTGALLKQMRVKNVDVTKMFQRVRADVLNQSGGKQVPFDESSIVGDFYFAGRDASAGNTGVNTLNAAETAFWQTIENSSDVRDLENYLTRVQRGDFAGVYRDAAESKIQRIKRSASGILWSGVKVAAAKLLKYDDVTAFSDGFAVVRLGDFVRGRWGFVDRSGNELTAIKYDQTGPFADGLGPVRVGDAFNGKWGFIDKTGREVVPPKYRMIATFGEGLAPVQSYDAPGKWGFIDTSGRQVLPFVYDYAGSFSGGLSAVLAGDWTTGKWGYIDRAGRVAVPARFDSAGAYVDGLAPVRVGDTVTGKWGFIDTFTQVAIPARYDIVTAFSEGLAAVKMGDLTTGKWGYIDKTGNTVIPHKYTFGEAFSNGLAIVQTGELGAGKWGVIDRSGKEVVPIKYEAIWCRSFAKEGIFGVMLNGRKGFVDIGGNEYFDLTIPSDTPSNSGPVPSNPVTIPVDTVTVREIDTAFKSNLMDDVIQKSQRLLQSNPNSPEANAYLGLALLSKRDVDNSASYLQKAIALGQQITLPFRRLKVVIASHLFEESMVAISKSEITISAAGSTFKAPISSISNSMVYNYNNQCGVALIEGQFAETSQNSKKVKQDAKKFNLFPPNSVLNLVQPQGGMAYNVAVCDQQTVYTTVMIKLLAGLRVSG